MNERLSLRAVLVVLGLFILAVPLAAQDFRGTISGSVTDSTGGVLPGVTVTVTNGDTNVASTVVTDSKGSYRVPYLISGTYSVEARLEGLKTAIRKGITIRVGDSLKIDLSMQTGGLEEVISVTAATPLLDTTSGNTGQVIDSKQIDALPLGDGTAYMLSRLAPGIADSSDLHFARPMDNGNLAGIVANGAQGGNEFTLDGAPNRVSPNLPTAGNNSGVVGFSPPSDAIAEFKVQTNSFDAQSGRTAGATVNLALKTGTNDLRGDVAYFNRSDARAMTPLLSKRAGADKPTREYDRYTGAFSGPIVHDRTFFMVAFEKLRDIQPEPSSYTVPTAKMRAGDMSEWAGVQIFDPFTATGSTNARKAFAGNLIPTERINRVAAAYAALYPLPNRPGLEENYFTNMLRPYTYSAVLGKVDHNFTPNNRLFVNAYWNKRQEDRYNWALGAENADNGNIGGFAVTQGFDYRSNTGGTLGFTSVLSSSTVVDVIGAMSKFGEWRKPGGEFDPASLGFSPTAVALMGNYKYLPLITFGGFSTTNANSLLASLGSARADFGTGFNRPFTNISLTPTVSALVRTHALKGGYELLHQQWSIEVPAYGAGRYGFNGAYTRANNSAPTSTVIAQMWAQFLLGLPTVGTGAVAAAGGTASQFEIASKADYRQDTHALFGQDDWQVTPKLTVNGGLRFELDKGMTEADNRNLAGFDATLTSPIAAAALANYTKNPIPQIPVSEFNLHGGVLFEDGPIYSDLHKLMPRAGFAYQLNDKTVIRGGAGLFSYTYYFDAGNQLGFTQPTGIITTDNGGTTFLTDMSNPIPSGQLVQPTGSSLGAATGLGITLGTIVPAERKVPYYTRYQFGGQRDLGAGWVVEAFYVGSRGKHLPVAREINGIPLQYLSTSHTRDTANETLLSQQVPNPFQGLLPGTTMNGATVARSQLLRPYPQYLGGSANGSLTGTVSVGTEEYAGSDRYDAGTIRIEKRFARGDSLVASYTRSHETDKLNYLNPGDGVLENRVSPNDRPNRATLGATFALPFGRGQKFGSEWRGFTDAILGGWSISTTYQYQSGFPLLWNNNVYYDPNRDPRDLHSYIGKHQACGVAGLDPNCPAWDTSGFYVSGGTGRSDPQISLANNVRYFPSTLPNVRTDQLNLMDVGIYKTFALMSGMRFQLRIEAINALNYTVLWNPNLTPSSASFGIVNQDRNNPRDIQIGGKLSF